MALLIKNGDIVTAEGRFTGDILCDGETIRSVGGSLTAPPDAVVIEAAGQLVLPGFIDPHVHIYLPCGSTCAKDTHATASQAALVGGTTTVLEMVGPSREEEPLAAFELWLEKARGRSACDFGFHMTVSRYDRRVETQLEQIVRRGVASFKIYLAYRGAFGLDDAELFQTLRLARRLGVITAAHCENAELIHLLQQQLLAQGRTGPEWHYASRPPVVEAEGVHHLLTFAELLEAHVYVVHLSCGEALRHVRHSRRRGVPVWAETLIQYLVLDRSCAERPNFEGAKYVMSPPLRDKKNQPLLWRALSQGVLDTLASDHAPFDFATQKRLGQADFTQIPSGLPGIEHRLQLAFTYGVQRGCLSLERLVEVGSTQPAKLFGLFPRKGAIQAGSDADLVIYDPAYRGKICAKNQHMNVDYSPYEGMAVSGRPRLVILRGQVAVQEGRFVGQPGRGRFLSREPSH